MSTERCRTCEMVARRDDGRAPPWDCIVRSQWWDIVHCDDTAVTGWMVLALRRHASAVAELIDEEAAELGTLVRDVSRALHEVLGCEKTYVVQFAESALHRHVHVHVIPRDTGLAEQYRGPGIFQLLGVPGDRRVPEDEMDELALRLRPLLSAHSA